jgi:DNA-binding NarL/FixJ family response regulator
MTSTSMEQPASGHLRIAVADDQHLVRAAFSSILSAQPDIEVVGEASNGAGAVQLCRSLNPDVILMDIRMPGVDGITATAALTEDPQITTRVLVLTTFDLDEYVFAALKAGASGFLLKDASPEMLVSALRAVAAGDTYMGGSVMTRLISAYVRRPDPNLLDRLASLTDRERQVLRQVGRGWSNTEIASALFISETTVKTHLARIFQKAHVRDRTQAVILAYETGLVTPGEPDVEG